MIRISLLLLLAAVSSPAAAYIGPGSGISLLSGIWTVLVGFVLVLAAILFWPIRYLIRRLRAKKNPGRAEDTNDPAHAGRDNE
ncbi:MAG TPA: hypothetical protein VKO85_10970 [Wenzhouxiangellaceae bacterium]|nr:hypothetical protein [Wenzhouxiangellaceae bacterium]